MTIATSIFTGLAGLGKTYFNIVSPGQDIIERVFVNDTFDKPKEPYGVSSPFEELATWQDIKSQEEFEQNKDKAERLKKKRRNDHV